MELNHGDMMRVLEQVSAIDQTLATFVSIHNALGIRPIQHFASASIRQELLSHLATGRELTPFALTEPGAGSNPRVLATQAIPDVQGGWRLRGIKIWSGSAAWAGILNVFARHLETDKISSFVVR